MASGARNRIVIAAQRFGQSAIVSAQNNLELEDANGGIG